jgi:hypothetical protein
MVGRNRCIGFQSKGFLYHHPVFLDVALDLEGWRVGDRVLFLGSSLSVCPLESDPSAQAAALCVSLVVSVSMSLHISDHIPSAPCSDFVSVVYGYLSTFVFPGGFFSCLLYLQTRPSSFLIVPPTVLSRYGSCSRTQHFKSFL